MTAKDLISYWLTVSTEDLETAGELYKLERYHHCLFFCHMTLEKILKGLVYKNTHSHPFPIHDLVKLARQAGITLTVQMKKDLEEITTWNIKARYDSYKRDFYKKATKEFTVSWFKKVKELFSWLKKQY